MQLAIMDLKNPQILKKIRFAGLSFLAFILLLTYSLARPATESLFLQVHTSKALPQVWFFVGLGMFLTLWIYVRNLARMDLMHLMGNVCAISAILLVGMILACQYKLPGSFYALYVWKDIYIVVLVVIFYSFANSVFPIKTARWAYGFFGVMASSSAFLGNLAVGYLAAYFGSLHLLWLIVPILLISWVFCLFFAKVASGEVVHHQQEKTVHLRDAVGVMRKSSYLSLILLLVLLVQLVITLIDFEFNGILEQAFADLDQRTRMIGIVYAVIEIATMGLNILTGPVLRLAGVPLVLLIVPVLLGSGVGIFAIVPLFMTGAGLKVASKCFDYSIYKFAREMLYIPLSYVEKTQGKSIIDMFMYRLAKVGVSVLLMGLIALHAESLTTWLILVLCLVWIYITIIIVKRFRRKVSRQDEMLSDQTLNTSEEIC
ncbi:MAG: Npt1/Npt2 family nucleotide transporter [Pseudomonadota bacterium]